MGDNKKDAVLIIVEPRSVYDFSACIDKQVEYSQVLSSEIWKMRERLGVDTVILASASPISIDNDVSDWNRGHLLASWYFQCFIEGYRDKDNNLINDEHAQMGKCFYSEGYTELSKEKGFGNYELLSYEQAGSIVDKTTAYIKELKETYNLQGVITVNDDSYTEAIIDTDKIESLGIPVSYFLPSSPWSFNSFGVREFLGSYLIYSDKKSIEGAIECFCEFNEYLKDPAVQKRINKKYSN